VLIDERPMLPDHGNLQMQEMGKCPRRQWGKY